MQLSLSVQRRLIDGGAFDRHEKVNVYSVDLNESKGISLHTCFGALTQEVVRCSIPPFAS
jgi:hypothetical protein